MKSLVQLLAFAVTVALFGSLAPQAEATHFRFANLSWKRAPGTNALAVEITVTEAWQRFSKGTIPYAFGDGSGSFSSAPATRIAMLMDQAGEEYEVWRYTTTHTYPSNGVFTVFGSSCCRISSLVNAGDDRESLTMLVDLRSAANTGSPVTTAPVILQMQAGTNNSIALPIVDPDGDAFTVRVATSGESSIPVLPSVGTNAISITAGGVLNWNTVGGSSGQKFALQVVIEENRAGNTTGTNGRVPLDFIIELAGSLTNLTPTVTGTNGSITLAPNQTFTTTFVGTDPEGGPLRVNHQGLPPGASITPADGTTNASPASVTFSWTPAPSDAGSSYAVLIFFTDQGGLQRAASFALTVSAAAAVRDFELLSINSGGLASGSGASFNPVASSNGQHVAFVSEATNLVASDHNRARDVFWRDRVAGTTRLVSRTAAGTSGNASSDAPAISPDGRYVAFHSRASDLVANDTNASYDVFLWDSQDNSVTLVSRTATGASGAGDSFSPQLSASGRVVAFASTAADLTGGDTNGTLDAFARDLDAGVTYLASINTNGASGNGFTGLPALSANGRHVAFLSRASDLVTNDFNTLNDVFVHDLQTRVTRLVSVDVAGTGAGNQSSFTPVISADGRHIAFASQATNLVTLADTNDLPDVFVRDMTGGVTKLVSVNGPGTAAGGNTGIASIAAASFTPFLSADGTKVLFVSLAQDLVANDSNGKQDIFLRDHVASTTTLVSTNRFGSGSGNADSGIGAYSMSADLRYVAFFSEASNLGAADTNSRTDVFLRDLATNSTKLISRVNLGGFSGSGHSFQPVLSADGSTMLFTSEAENLDNRDTNSVSDVFAASTALGAPNFGVVDVGVSISTVTARTVGGSFALTITITNHSANPATGLVVGRTAPAFLQFLSATGSQGVIGPDSWVVGDLAANGSATATVTLVATNLGAGDVVASITQRDQLDSNLNNNAALSTVTVNRTAAGALFHLPGNTAYLSRTNSPFFADILTGAVTLEAFERGNFSLAGVTASAGTNLAASAITDSVDADDGTVDGSGNGGQSFFVTGTNAVTFSFNAAILGRLPTRAGIVLTDGDHAGAGLEAFDTNGVSLGVIGPFEIGDSSFFGETAEDRFLGVEFAGGISAVRVFYASPGFELDHLQFDLPTTDLAMSGSGPAAAAFGANFVLTLTVTNRGPVAATGVVVTNADPGDVGFVSVTTSQGTVDTMSGTWSVGTLAAGGSATFTATLTPGGSGFLLFRAGVSSAVPDAHTGNDLVTLGVSVPNQAPSVRFAPSPLMLSEDLPALSFPAFGQVHPQETNQFITNITVTVDNPGLFAVPPVFHTNGTLDLALAGNAVGTAVVTVTATDNGGTLAGGVATGSNSFVVTVTAVNDAPLVTLNTTLIGVLEDSGAFAGGAGFASFSAGPANESGQTLVGYTVSNNNDPLFSVPPAINTSGMLTFTPAANSNGVATVTVIAQDDGGTASSGVDRTTNTFTIAVTNVNDAPVVMLSANQVVVAENAGVQNLPGFITSSSVGPANESAQTISFLVTNDNNALFTVQPAISPAGELTYTVAAGVSGLAVVTVRAQDTGGTANGGSDTSEAQTFNLTVTDGSSAAAYVWLGGTGNWNDPAGWTPRGVPGVLDTATINSGTIQLTDTVTVAILTHDGGTLGGAGSVTIRSNMTWTGGVMSGAGTTTIASGATLTISGAAEKNLNRRLDNYGTVTWTGGRITGDAAPVINNYAGAIFDMQTDATLFESYGGGARTFNNSGTLRKSMTSGSSFIHGTFNQSGTVDAQGGSIQPSTTINVNTATFSGAGRFLVASGTLTLNGTVTVAGGANFEFAGGTLTGTGTIAGTLNWTGGIMAGPGTTIIATNGALVISGVAEKNLNRQLDNYGTVTWSGGRITGDSGPVFNNQAGAVFDIQTDATFYESYGGGTRTLNNAGLVRKSAGTGANAFQGLFNNSGTVGVQTGTLGLQGGGTSSGTFTNATGAIVDFTGGTHVLSSGASFSGAGKSRINGGTVAVGTNATVSVTGVFELATGTLGGEGTFAVPAGSEFRWTGGIMSGTGTTSIATNGTLNLSGVAEKNLNRRLDNYGTVTWTGGRITGDAAPVINNFAGALFDLQTDATLFESYGGGARTFNNAGTLRKSVATGTSSLQGTFNQGGTVDAQTGTIHPITTINVSTATFSGAGRFLVSGGTLTLSGTVTVASGGNFEFASGTLTGTGTVVGALNWTGGSMVAPGTTTIATNGELVISGAMEKNLNRQLDNFGKVTWTGGRITGDTSPVFNNLADAVFDAQTDASLYESYGGGARTLNNAGTVRKSAGTGTSTWLGSFSNTGAIEIQQGILSLAGDYAPTAGSSLKVFLGGLTAGTQYGQLRIVGTATLTGALNIVLTNSFVPVSRNTFLVVDSGAGSGAFSSLSGDDLGGGLTLVPGYSAGDVTLTATMVAALPPLSPQATGTERLLRWPGDSGGYVLEAAVSITGPWTPVLAPVAQENGGSVVRLPAGGTRFYRLVPAAPPRPGDNPTQ